MSVDPDFKESQLFVNFESRTLLKIVSGVSWQPGLLASAILLDRLKHATVLRENVLATHLLDRLWKSRTLISIPSYG